MISLLLIMMKMTLDTVVEIKHDVSVFVACHFALFSCISTDAAAIEENKVLTCIGFYNCLCIWYRDLAHFLFYFQRDVQDVGLRQ